METIDIHEAVTHLPRLLEQVANGGSFVITKADKPIAKLVPMAVPDTGAVARLGFMAGQLRIPPNFDRLGREEIESTFNGVR